METPEALLTVLIVGIQGAWLLMTVLQAAPIALPFQDRIRSQVTLRFIPQWNFFAPNPGTHDYHLLYRDRLAGGGMGPWREVAELAAGRKVIDAVWHPSARRLKGLMDVVAILTLHAAKSAAAPDLVKLSTGYLVILNYVSSVPRSQLSVATQFLVMQSSRTDPPEVLFTSGVHVL